MRSLFEVWLRHDFATQNLAMTRYRTFHATLKIVNFLAQIVNFALFLAKITPILRIYDEFSSCYAR